MPLAPRLARTRKPAARVHVHVEIANRHARSGEEHAAVGDGRGDVAGDASLERLVPRVEQRVDCRAHRSVGLMPLVEPLRSRRGQRRRRRHAGPPRPPRDPRSMVSVGAPIGVGHEVVRVDDEQPVRAADQLLHTARRRRRADLDDEIGMVPLPECRHRRRAASPAESAPRPAVSARDSRRPESGSASSGQPRSAHSSTSPAGGTRRRPATTTTRWPVLTSRRNAGMRSIRRCVSVVRRRRALDSAIASTLPPVGSNGSRNGRFRCTGPGGRPTARVDDRLDPDRAQRCRSRARRHRHAGVAEPLDETAEEILLVDRLVGADTVQLGRPVGGHHDDRHARHGRLDDGREVIRRRGSRRAEHRDRFSGRGGDAQVRRTPTSARRRARAA